MNAKSTEEVRGGMAIGLILKHLGVYTLHVVPGTQTLGLLDELEVLDGVGIEICLEDGAAAGIADGQGRVKENLSAVCLYEFAGLANGAGGIYSALTDRRPMIIFGTQTGTNEASRMWAGEVDNIAAYAAQMTKETIEIFDVSRIEEQLRRAAQIALTPPYGPVYVGVRTNLFIEKVARPKLDWNISVPRPAIDSDALAKAVELVAGAEGVVIIAGGDVADSGALDALATLSDKYSIPVMAENYATRLPLKSSHPMYFRGLSPLSPVYKEADVILSIGAKVAKRFAHMPFEFLNPGQKLCHVHLDAAEISRVYPTEVAMVAEAKSFIDGLAQGLADKGISEETPSVKRRREFATEHRTAFLDTIKKTSDQDHDEEPAHPYTSLRLLGEAIRPQDVVVDETIGFRHLGRNYMDLENPANYYATQSGFMGWGVPAATGIAQARPKDGSKTVLFVGDGCILMTPQGLWNAAKNNLDVVYVVLNNRGWVCLDRYYDLLRKWSGVPADAKRPGVLFDEGPEVDYSAIAKGFGVPGIKVTKASEIPAAMEKALTADGPTLVDLVIGRHKGNTFAAPGSNKVQ